jgi:2-phosphoglycerate kinase
MSSAAAYRKHAKRRENRILLIFLLAFCFTAANALSVIKSRAFLSSPRLDDRPKLILISGCSGTGKSTFGMSVALDQGILKCISTDTVRSVMRSFIDAEISPALHRSSFSPAGANDDPITSWRETCTVLKNSLDVLVNDMIRRGDSLVVEGVHVVPGDELIRKWEASGGVALGILLTVADEEAHKSMLIKRGAMTGKGEDEKLHKLERVRAIQNDMIRLAKEANWLMVEQDLRPDPLEQVASRLWSGESSHYSSPEQVTSKSERQSPDLWSKKNATAAEEKQLWETAHGSLPSETSKNERHT